MPLLFTCPHCGHQTSVPDEYIGQSGPCTSCGQTVTIGGSSEELRCPQCNASVPQNSTSCPACGYSPHAAANYENLGDNAGMRMLLPVGRSWLAIAAGYAGLFAVLCLPAPIALILGLLAIWDIKTHPDRHGMGRAIFAIVMGTIGSAFLLFGIISAMAG